MSMKYFVNPQGVSLGGFLNAEPPANSIEVPDQAPNGNCVWDFVGELWVDQGSSLEDYKFAIQMHLDSVAQTLGYDNITTAITYAEEPAVPKFQQEAVALRAWRSLVWEYCYGQLALVEAGTIATPSIEQIISELPVLEI